MEYGWSASPLGWNIVGVSVLAIRATRASSVALTGFGLDSLIEIGASTAATVTVSFTLEAAKTRTGRSLESPVLMTEGKVTFVDGVLAVAVLAGISMNVAVGWWWADPAAGLAIVDYATREAYHILTNDTGSD